MPCFDAAAHLPARPQARALWHWSNYLHALLGGMDGQPLHVNLDETHVWLRSKPRRGSAVCVSERRQHRRVPVERAGTADTRAGYTHVATICDDADVQRALPQLIVVGSRLMSAALHVQLLPQMPANVYLLRTDRGWNSAQLLARVVRLVATAAAGVAPGRPVILSMDAARLHFAFPVLQACRRHGVHFLLIPAQMTWLLQPCDTKAFALYKADVAEFVHRCAAAAADGKTSLSDSIFAVVHAIREVLERRSWSRAFSELGLCGSQDELSHAVLRHLELTSAPVVPAAKPTQDELVCVFPRRTVMPYMFLWHPVRTRATSAATPPSPPLPPPSIPPEEVQRDSDRPWFGRTRSSSATNVVIERAPSEAASSSAAPAQTSPAPHPSAPWMESQQVPPRGPSLPRAKRLPSVKLLPPPAPE